MKWKKYLVISISILGLTLSEQILQACADYVFYDRPAAFYGNEAPDKPAYTPFYFISDDLYYDTYRWNGHESYSINDSINKAMMLDEWKHFLPEGIPLKDIEAVLFRSDIHLFEQIKAKQAPDEGNALTRFLQQKQNKPVFTYLMYAKQCESLALRNSENWTQQSDTISDADYQTLEDAGLQYFKKEKSPFLRMKYAFQILRMAFYNQDYQHVLDLFDQLLKDRQDSSLAYTRCIGFKAGAYYHLDNYAQAGYYYTKMFDNSNAYKWSAMISFCWSLYKNDSNHFNQIYQRCQNDHERAVAVVMKTLRTYEPALSQIKKAYRLDPKVDGISVLMNREINKLEEFYFSKKMNAQNQIGYPRYSWQNAYSYRDSDDANDSLDRIYQPYIDSLKQFSNQLIKDKMTGTPALWHLTNAYLAGMQSRPPEMKNQLAKAQQAGMNPNEESLFKVIDLLSDLNQTVIISKSTEQKILPKLKALSQLGLHNDFAQHQFRDIMNNIVAGKYFRQGDTIKGIYAMAHSNRWYNDKGIFYASSDFDDLQGQLLNNMSIADLDKVIAFRNSSSKSAYEEWLVSQTYYTDDALNDLKGVKYIRQRNFKAAAEVFKKINSDTEYFDSPFMPQINDYIYVEEPNSGRQYSKYGFSLRMAELQNIIAKNPNDAGALYGYAVALYNISYYGKEAGLSNYFRHSTDPNGYFKQDSDQYMPAFLKEYYRVFEAEKYFNKAAIASQDPELKAKALWGAAKCWTKRCPAISGEPVFWYDQKDYDNYYQNALKSPYFQQLSADYQQTAFMQKVKSQCEYYADYLQTQH